MLQRCLQRKKETGSQYSYFGRHSRKAEYSTENLSQNMFHFLPNVCEDHLSNQTTCKQSGMRNTYCSQAAKIRLLPQGACYTDNQESLRIPRMTHTRMSIPGTHRSRPNPPEMTAAHFGHSVPTGNS